jgi:photosystem II stability/assembly factor-like uncharacterized protein
MQAFFSGRGLVATLSCAALAVATAFAAGGDAARAVPDLLAQPAQANVRAAASLQLSVTRAGKRLVSVGERGLVLLSDDDGRSWRQARQVPVSVALTQVRFVSDSLGWAVGHSGVVLHSADGGDTWQRQLDGVTAAKIVAEAARAAAASGDPAALKHQREAEGLVQDGPDKPFLGLHFADANRGWVVGAYGLALVTQDGGKTWASLMARIPNPGGKHLYAVGEAGGRLLLAGEQGTLIRSTDGGASFQRLTTPYTGTFFGALEVADGGLLAYGLRGNVWRSADQGANWTRIELAQPVTLSAALKLADGAVLLADESGRLLRGDAAGKAFAPLVGALPTGLSSLAQAADGALIVSGARGLSRIEATALAATPIAEPKK